MLTITTMSKCSSIKKTKDNLNKDKDINLFYQFFIHSNIERHKEITYCLRKNIENKHITKIYLLNERVYTLEEMGISSSIASPLVSLAKNKIIQVITNIRLQYAHVFNYVTQNNIKGYIIINNADIFFNDTLQNLYVSTLHHEPINNNNNNNSSSSKQMFAQLRFEYNKEDIAKSELFGPRTDSQDTWIFHSNNMIQSQFEKLFEFELGMPGCDNKIVYLMMILGYEVINDPYFIKTFHYHTTNIRNYTNDNRIIPPYACIIPAGLSAKLHPRIDESLKLSFHDNNVLYNYVKNKINLNQNFIIPRISCFENTFAVNIRLKNMPNNTHKKIQVNNWLNNPNVLQTMKNNAGIKMSNEQSFIHYSNSYLKAYENCDLYGGWNIIEHVYSHSQDYINEWYLTKRMFCSFAFDIFHYIHSSKNPWTLALKGKRILIISAFEESILEKLPNRDKIYGLELFPDCTFVTIKPPQTQGDEPSDEYYIEADRFFKRLDKLKNKYDIALVSCGGYGNMVCNYIYENHEKSAIYVGGVLQMYFGILGNRWRRERYDIIKLFVDGNPYWSSPKESEKPKNHVNVEGSCYW